ncbi:ArsR/SmtB family transcription factor [Halogranum amylolyticum]|uniref:ArsR/SmtB family transcription factor n=1 Tax=Halogranum amylolyticum TaxID=660520 RepID=UPI001B8CEF6B|nr:helix-turn-helix domain-containing protein [Halogranum amylolyticum]
MAAKQKGEIQILGIDEDETADVFDALSSDTARHILSSIYDEPAPPSELATRLDLSVQNVSYHLDRLHDIGLVQVADTRYSEKGKEMNVYAPADNPVVMFVGTEKRTTGFRNLLKRLVGATTLLSLVSAFLFIFQAFGRPGGAGDGTTIIDLLSFPGLEFLLGGLFILGLFFLWWIRTQ